MPVFQVGPSLLWSLPRERWETLQQRVSYLPFRRKSRDNSRKGTRTGYIQATSNPQNKCMSFPSEPRGAYCASQLLDRFPSHFSSLVRRSHDRVRITRFSHSHTPVHRSSLECAPENKVLIFDLVELTFTMSWSPGLSER